MKDSHQSTIAVLIVSILLLGTHSLFAEDWPQWLGAGRDATVSDFSAPDQWPETLTETWKVNVGSGDATPALVGDKLYVFARQGGDEVILCLNAATGDEMWKDQYSAKEVTGPASRHPGPRSSLAVAEGKVVTLGVSGVLSCLNSESGEVMWRKDPFPDDVPRFFTSASPLIADGMVIAFLGGAGNGAIMAYNLSDGEVKWQWADEGPDYGSPVLMTVDGVKQIVTFTEKSIVGVNLADGKLLWQRPFATVRRAYNASTPIVDGQTVYYSGAGRGTFAVKIEKQGDEYTATELWSNPDVAAQYNTPVLHEGVLYGFSSSGNLFCLDAATGETKWLDDTSLDRSGFGTIVDAGSVLMALPSSAELIIYKPDASAFSQTARIKVSETATYAFPVVSGNRIYIKDQENVILYSVG